MGKPLDPPEVRYVRSGELFIAYQVLGQGPLDLVYVSEFWHSIEAQWEEPSFAAFLRGLTSFGRLICFDQRGTGISDPVALDQLPTLEVWMDDVRAVMDAVGSRRAVLVTSGGGSAMGMTFAATYPEKVHALVIINGTARYSPTTDYPFGTSPEFEDRVRRETEDGWGRGVLLDVIAPTRADDPALRAWWARYQRLGSSPGTQLAQRKMLMELDVRHVLPSIRVPTLLIHRIDNRLVHVEHGRYLAAHIHGARLVEIPGSDYFLWLDATDRVLKEIGIFLGTSPEAEDHDRMPARAIRCATAIADATRALGIEARAGLHTGEVEAIGEKVSGLAVHIGARVAGVAAPGEVLVSSTVRDLVAGSGIAFEDRGLHALKGVPEGWQLFRTIPPEANV